MGLLFEALTLPDNLEWAWRQVKQYYGRSKDWHDEVEIAAFESDLSRNLKSIAASFERKSYRLGALRPLPQPKKPDKDGQHPARQYFWVPVRDQVAWAAIVNVIGPTLDDRMPTWSYGNRLFRTVWFTEEVNGRIRLHIGRYRHTSREMYRRFNQSWPVFRRHIYLTARRMGVGRPLQPGDLEDQATADVLANESALVESAQLPYLRDDFWTEATKVYWAGIDFEKFYPKLPASAIACALRRELQDEPELTGSLLDDLLSFRVDTSGFSTEELEKIQLPGQNCLYKNLPTGLLAAGFLANVTLLDIDREVQGRTKRLQVAHFRYVDDHVILATSFDSLRRWITEYKKILDAAEIGISVNPNKIMPCGLKPCLNDKCGEQQRRKAESACLLDADLPTPLLTQTLARISNIRGIPIELLGDDESQRLLSELQHLLLADFSEEEIRQDTLTPSPKTGPGIM